MDAIVIDIETAGEAWEEIDSQTQHILADRITRFHPELTQEQAHDMTVNELGTTPFTGQIIALGALDCQTNKGAVYYQAPGETIEETDENGVKIKQSKNETEILEQFWRLSERYNRFVTFNGRMFDMPYIMVRSAINGIRPTKDLMKNRYLNYQSPSALHIDLYDQLSFYGSFQRLGGLHLACRAFNIVTPKDGVIDGSKVGQYYRDKRYKEIASYNARDLFATKELYDYWQKYLAF